MADKVFPNVPVEKQSDRYLQLPRGQWFRIQAEPRAPGTESAGSGFAVDFNSTYFAQPYAIHKDVDDQTRANQTAPLQLDREATEWVTQQMMLRREHDWVTKYMTSGVWTTDLTGVAAGPNATQFVKWSQAGSTPIEDITSKVIVVARLTGFKPNTIVMTPDVFQVLQNHPEFLDRIKYTQKGIVTEEIMASVLGVDRVLVTWAVFNNAAEGAADNFQFVATASLFLCYAAPAPSLLKPSAGYTFSWTGYLGAGMQGNRISRFRMEHLRSDRVEGEMAYDQKVVAADLGVMFNQAI